MSTEHRDPAVSARLPHPSPAPTDEPPTDIAPARIDIELERFDRRRPDLTPALRAAQQGDQRSFGLIYDDLHPRLLRYLRALVKSDAEDVASETWLQIGRDIRTFRGDWRQWRSWAVTVARHRALDHIRHQQRRPTAEIPLDQILDMEGHDNTEATAIDRIASEAALSLVTALPRREAEAVLLRTVIGLSAAEAGRLLGTEPGAVRSAAHRGLRKLAGLLGPNGLTP